jgi:hypothetical protein
MTEVRDTADSRASTRVVITTRYSNIFFLDLEDSEAIPVLVSEVVG